MNAYDFTRTVKSIALPPLAVILTGVESASISGIARRAGADRIVSWSDLRVALPAFLKDCVAKLAKPTECA
jgi:hypothetical protein